MLKVSSSTGDSKPDRITRRYVDFEFDSYSLLTILGYRRFQSLSRENLLGHYARMVLFLRRGSGKNSVSAKRVFTKPVPLKHWRFAFFGLYY
jgi:hypothetical protein